MSIMKLSYSPLVKGPADVLRQYENIKDAEYHTGVDVAPTSRLRYFTVSSIFAGVVTYIGRDARHWVVIVEYDYGVVVRYGHLKSVSTKSNYAIRGGESIGVADSFCHFEYCQRVDDNGKTPSPLYVYDRVYRRVTAMDVVDGKTKFFMATDSEMIEIQFSQEVDTLEYRLTQEEYFQKLYISVEDLPQYNNYLYPEITDD